MAERLRLFREIPVAVCDASLHLRQVYFRGEKSVEGRLCITATRKGEAMNKPLTQHELAALGLRQTLSDLDCAEGHLDMVLDAVDEEIAGLPDAIQAVRQALFGAHEQLVKAQRKVYAAWHETLPPIESA